MKPPNDNRPKYLKLVDNIRRDIIEGKLKKGDTLPSINGLAKSEKVARDTVVKAYNELRRRGIIEANQGKSFYVKTDQLKTELSVLLIFDVLNSYKESLFNGIRENLDESVKTEVYFHHFNSEHFASIIENNKNSFDEFVVMAYSDDQVYEAIQQLPPERTTLLDRKIQFNDPTFRFVGQDHAQGLIDSLEYARDKIASYEQLNFVFREQKNHPQRMKNAFRVYGESRHFNASISPSLATNDIRKNEAYLVIDEEDLVTVIKACESNGWIPGKDVGLIAYNDTPLMEIVANGVSVVSTDFYQMGKQMAECLSNGFSGNHEHITPTQFISRNTL